MPRTRDMSEVVNTQKRWSRLLKYTQKLYGETKKPMTNAKRRASVVVVGRIINNLVCAFAVSDQLTNKTLHDLNAVLMRLDKQEDVMAAYSLEHDILKGMEEEIVKKISDLEREIQASKVFT